MAELIDQSNYQDFTLETLRTPDGMTRLNSILRQLAQNVTGDTESVRIFTGVGTPEASVAAGIGSLYMRTDGGADTAVYRKETGSGNTGWVAVKSPATLPLSVANGGFGADNSAVPQGYIPYMSATGVISWLAVGTSGQFLKTQGASANPLWADIPAQKFELISTTTITGATTTGSISITSGNTYLVSFNFKNFNAVCQPGLQFNGDTNNTHYRDVIVGRTTSAAVSLGSATGQSQIRLLSANGVAASSTQGMMGTFFIQQIGTASQIYRTFGQTIYDDDNGGATVLMTMVNNGGQWSNAENATSFAIITGSAATMDGTVYLYKVATS